MSLILEALRKSEAERRRGLPPDVHAELPPAPEPRPRRWPTWVRWLLPALILILVALIWLWPPQADAPAQLATTKTPPASGTAGAPAPATTRTLPARTPAPVQRGSSSAAIEPASDESASDESASIEPAASAPDPSIRAPAPTSTTPAATASPPPGVDTATVAQPSESERTPAKPTDTAKPATAAASPSASADAAERVLSLQDLDSDTRSALPPLKLSMHLWNETPAQRFVILDGQRLGEGDRIGEASIVRIERDGVLLEWQGRGLRIPVR